MLGSKRCDANQCNVQSFWYTIHVQTAKLTVTPPFDYASRCSLVENNNVVIVVTNEGHVKRMGADEWAPTRRGTRGKLGTSSSSSSGSEESVTLASDITADDTAIEVSKDFLIRR